MFERYVRREGFFAFFEDIGPPGSDFLLFGVYHLALLAAIAAVTVLFCIFYKRLGTRARRRTVVTIVLTMFALEALKQLSFLIIHGQYFPYLAPFHLCDIAIFVALVHAFRPNKTTAEILYSLCLPGAIAAKLFTTWAGYPMLNYYFINSHIIHTLHIVFVFILLTSGELRPDIKQLWRPAVFLAVIAPPIYFFNVRFGTNFLFVNAGSEGSPLELFVNIFGIPWFLIPYAALVAVIWLAMYLPWRLSKRGRARAGQ